MMAKLSDENRVQLAVSYATVAKGIVVGFHTAVCIDGDEISFNNFGIQTCPRSRQKKGSKKLFDLGFCTYSTNDVFQAFFHFFKPGSYDIIHKNCNSFTDCVLYFLLGLRLDPLYTTTERHLKDFPGVKLWEMVVDSLYDSNHFSVDNVIRELDELPYGI